MMPATVLSGRASPTLPSDEIDPAPEPFLIESVLADIRELLRRSRRLNDEVAAAEAAHAGDRAWHRVAAEVGAVHQRVEKALRLAAARDGVTLATGHPLAAAPDAGVTGEAGLSRCRRWARELEQHCAAAISQSRALGLDHLAQALGRWRRDLIGLEQPLIAAHADTTAGSRRR